jgi:hypothetical protein
MAPKKSVVGFAEGFLLLFVLEKQRGVRVIVVGQPEPDQFIFVVKSFLA